MSTPFAVRSADRFVIRSPADLDTREELSVLTEAQLHSLRALVVRYPRCDVAVETCGGGSFVVRVWSRSGRLVSVRHVFPPGTTVW